ncbi:MAG: glycosyltransferase family 4 protein [Parcubacteria group bacterium]|nr:glycosyltransferase family 4 protein [Parcubacteria group bacterium]
MNVCFIGKHKYPKDIFSNELDMKTWRSLADYFGKVFVIAESPDLFFHKAYEKNISVYLLPRLGFGYISFVKQSVYLGLYLNWRYSVDVFDASEIAGGGTAVAVLKFFTGKPIVIEVQGEIFRKRGNGKNLKNWLLQRIGRYAMKKAARVRVISHAIFNQVREQGIPESKIRLVSLRVDLNLFNPLLIYEINSFVDKVWISIGYIGRLVEGKGLEDLFGAISVLKSHNLGFQCLIFGTGPLEKKLKKLAEELNIEDKIKWRGFVSYGKVPQALSEIDIFVYPSWHEGFGRSIMEALAMEKAVVATRVGGITDLINDGENGFLIEPNNPEALALKIKELMENKNLREKFGKAGREWVSKNFEWNNGIKKFAEFFLEIK